jgi:hypothetical protein
VRGLEAIAPANNVIFRSAGILPVIFPAFPHCKDAGGTPALQNMACEISFSFHSFPCAVRGLIRILTTMSAEAQLFGMRGQRQRVGFPCG